MEDDGAIKEGPSSPGRRRRSRSAPRGPHDAGSDSASEVAWTTENAADTTHPVASLASNGCGTYDLSGNVWEWVSDWEGYYSSLAVEDPAGPTEGSGRVARGGGWNDAPASARLAERSSLPPSDRSSLLGFRLARSAP